MAVQARTIKRRIKSVKNTKKITKAMELVAASKMRKAVNAVMDTRPYAELAWRTVQSIGDKVDVSEHPMLSAPDDADNILMLLIASDRGLAGGFNTYVIREAVEMIKETEAEADVDTICVGKKATLGMQKRDIPVLASFEEITKDPKYDEILPIGRMLINKFLEGKYKRVVIAYTDFQSALKQEPKILNLLPLGPREETEAIGEVDEDEPQPEVAQADEYTFEPNPSDVLDKMLPRLVETTVYQAVLESAASEHSSRMMAMKNASDSANDMIDDLNFEYNQARQASITREIAEISSGKAALENK
jgi:F-type H+-transporting ATPase subunit gamma